ncbi:MAG: RNA polymerase factor sigma-54 [Alphaproteobacteria bacterium]|nr:RNA polymerase factor sigma-54 [Alphaproteobacteria bacterium]
MALSQRLTARQSQSLIMTPQLQQAIKLLQFGQIELNTYIERELERNPLLELDAADGAADGAVDGAADGAADEPQPDTPPQSDAKEGADTDTIDMADPAWRDDSPAFAPDMARGANRAGQMPNIWETAASSVSLRDHLSEQINIDIADLSDRLIAGHMVDYLDEAGYIQTGLAEIADTLGCPERHVERLLDRLQKFDPPGIFARDLKECLGLQLKDQDRLDPAMQSLLANLELLAQGDTKALMRICAVAEDDLADMIAELRALDPKPALAFDHTVAQAVRPDVILRRAEGAWHVELNADALPKPIVNRAYYAMLVDGARGKSEREFVVDRLNSANWLVKALHQRATTILTVSSEIVRRQIGFFDKGIQHLKPLILRDIAEAVDMHESTISRATANKYIETPRGIFELKYFFTNAVSTSDGEGGHSAEAVRHRIRSLIDEETLKNILSDDKIVALLRRDGVDVARRTVAKYRVSMAIPSSVQRRRRKKTRAVQ